LMLYCKNIGLRNMHFLNTGYDKLLFRQQSNAFCEWLSYEFDNGGVQSPKALNYHRIAI